MKKKLLYYVGEHMEVGAYEVKNSEELLGLPQWSETPKVKNAKLAKSELPTVDWLKKDTLKWAKSHKLKLDHKLTEVEILMKIYAHFGYSYGEE